MTTIREIAKQLGVSFSTVSAVINKRQYVSAAMRARVEKALEDANYRPNQFARGLRLRESRTIGLIVPDLANPFFSRLVRGAEDYLTRFGYRLIVADSREDWKREQDYLVSFAGKTTDGIILATCATTDQQVAMIPEILQEVPWVFVDRCPLRTKGICLSVDNVRAAYDATQHLIELGHRRIAIVTGPLNLLNADERFKGYKRALRAHDIPMDRRLVRTGDNTEDSGYRRGLDLLHKPDRPTAILVCNNLMTMGVVAAIRKLGIACPREVSLLGFDDFNWCSLLTPSLTMVRQPESDLGTAAAKAVLDRLHSAGQGVRDKVLLPTQLIVRESTAAPSRGSQTQQ
jgi:DNA-binding LacI/PurR family transcriptional regulator